MPAGSVKGTVMESVVADVARLLEQGRITRELLNHSLTPDDQVLLAGHIMPSLWYPSDAYARMVKLLVRVEGGDEATYLAARGRRTAERLYKAGLYRQLDATLERWGQRFGALMESLGVAMFKGTDWRVEHQGGAQEACFHIEVRVPADFPECARYSSQGFIEYLGSRAQSGEAPVRCTSSRPEPTRIVFETAPA